MWNKGEEEECERVRERDERSGSSQRREAAHTNHRGLSQELLAHCWDTGRPSCLRQREQAVRGTRQSEGPGGQRDPVVTKNSQRKRKQATRESQQ